jgi:lipopolysaccharide export system protein LptA
MSRVKSFLSVSVVCMLACWFGCASVGSATLTQPRTVDNPITLSADRIAVTQDGIKAENAALRTADGKLEAKADGMLIPRSQSFAFARLQRIDLTGKVTLALKGDPKIEASAAKAHIDLQAQVVELEGDVSVTTFQTVSGKLVPTTVRGSSARILMAEKLGQGQERVQITAPVPKEEAKETAR